MGERLIRVDMSDLSAQIVDFPEEWQLPSNLKDSVENLRQSKEAVELFGKQFTEHFIATRDWEVREYEKAITDWQLKRYFEII